MEFDWHPDEKPPLLEEHSKAKLDVLRGYLRAYIDRLNKFPHRDQFKLDLVDGFAGGGIYSDMQGDTLPGSPLIMLEEIDAAKNRLNLGRKKPLGFDCKFYFVDKKQAHTDCLKKTLTDHGYKADGSNISICTGMFKDHCDRILAEIKHRQPRSGRAIFLLDQTGWSLVNLKLIRNIFEQLPSAEIILTFAVDALFNFALNNPNLIKPSVPLELSGQQMQALIESRDLGGKAVMQRTLLEHVRHTTNATFYTPFFIRPRQSRRSLWFLHLSRHPIARDVMVQQHWDTYNTFEHYGTGDLEMLGWGPLMDSATIPVFGFKDYDAKNLQDKLTDSLLHELFGLASEQPVMYESVKLMYANRTAARFSDMDEAVLRLIQEQEIEILNSDGKRRSRNLKIIAQTDRIALPSTSLIPGLSHRHPKS